MEARTLPETSVEHFQLSLRIRHPSMDPAELSRAFKIEPEYCFRAGEPRSSSIGRVTGATHSESYWLGVLQPGAYLQELGSFFDPKARLITEKQLAATFKSLSVALPLAIRFFGPHASLLRRVRSEDGQATLLVSIYNPEALSFTIPAEASQRLGELGIGVEFELAGA